LLRYNILCHQVHLPPGCRDNAFSLIKLPLWQVHRNCLQSTGCYLKKWLLESASLHIAELTENAVIF